MAREKKVGLASALGAAFEIVNSLLKEVEKQGGDENDLRLILASEWYQGKIAKLLVGKTEIVWQGTVEIDHSLSFDDRVKNYGMVFSQIRKLYPITTPITGIEKKELALVRFGRVKSVIEMERELNEMALKRNESWMMAGAEEAIAFGDQRRELVCKFEHIMSIGDSKFSEQDAPASEELIPMLGSGPIFKKIGRKIYFEALSLSWSVPGGLTLSSHQFFNETWPGCCVLCRTN